MKRDRWLRLWLLFWTFVKIGPSTFGGGYAMIPVIQREVTEKRGWMDEAGMNDVLAIAGSAPGGIGVNASAFIGYRLSGIAGAVVAVIGMTLPTFLIAFLLSFGYAHLQHNPKVAGALEGLHAAIVGLIVVAGYRMGRSGVFDKTTLATVVGTVIVLLCVPIHPIAVMGVGLVIGMLLVKIKELAGLPIQLEKQVQETDGSGRFKYDDYYMADGI
ncbi:chromate transporter [Paenibacillus sp. YYML68]|uniref:chromate transporter n=1 Tax=Paenibacillus sp. YYML68 TaxID=2909250 RepID=UPI0024914E8A|nr:chromate transporter [Paenibacillus sp. YYML68]